MKKFLCILCILATVLSCTACAINDEQTETIVYDDGSYMVVTINASNATYETTVEDDPELLPQSNAGSDGNLYQPLSRMIIVDEDGRAQYFGFSENPYFTPNNRISWVKKNGKWVAIYKDVHGMPKYDSVFATKKCSYYSADGRLLWTMSLTGVFRENAVNRNCDIISSKITVWEQDSWYVIAEETGGTIDSLSYTIRFGRKNLGVTIAEPSYTVSLSRDTDGVFH